MVNSQFGDLGVSHWHRSPDYHGLIYDVYSLSWDELLPSSLVDDGLNCDGSQDDLERFHYVVGDDIAKEIFRRCPTFKTRLRKIGCNWNLIHLASQYGDDEFVKALVTKDASICSLLDLSNKSPLDIATMSWTTRVIDELLSPKVCIHLGVSKVKLLLQNALCIAVREDRSKAFRVLATKYMGNWVHRDIEFAAEMDTKARLLTCAIQVGDFEGYKDLVDRCPYILEYVTPFPFGGTPLHIAIKVGKGKLTEFVKDIIRRKPEFARELDHKGHTPLDIASIHGYLEIVKELLDQVGTHLCSPHNDTTYWNQLNGYDHMNDDPDEYHMENINDTYVKTKLLADKDGDYGHIIYNTKDETLYYGRLDTPLAYALRHDRISVINELLPIWWKSYGVLLKSRDLSLFKAAYYFRLKTTKEGEYYSETLKLLMAWYMRHELSNSEDWDTTNASQLASSYQEIVDHLFKQNILRHLSLFFAEETKEEGTQDCSAVIEVAGSTTNEEANVVYQMLMTTYYPECFREVTAQSQSVLNLWVDKDKSVITFKLSVRSVLFRSYGKFCDILSYWFRREIVKVDNVVGTLFTIWGKNRDVDKLSPEDKNQVPDGSEGGKDGTYEGVVAADITQHPPNDEDNNDHRNKYGEAILNAPGKIFIDLTRNNHDVDTSSPENENQVPGGAEGAKDGTNEDVVIDITQQPPNDEDYNDDCNEITTADNLIGNNSIMINQTYTSSLFGQKHSSAKECRGAILDASIRDKRYVKFEKSTRKLVIAKCSHESCQWRLDAKAVEDGFLVSETITEHTCSASSDNAINMATSAWVCPHIINSVRQNPGFQPKEIIDLIEDEFQIKIDYMTAYRAREQAIVQIHGLPTDSNNILPNYIDNILRSNPDSIAISEPTQDDKYHRVFISYKACKNGFLNGCPDLVFFEKCPIKQGHEGNILAAISVDGNNEMFPFAFAIVETDSKSAWEYFFRHLKSFVGDLRSMTIISNPSYNQLSAVIQSYFPEAKHGPCTWNLAREMAKKFGSKIVDTNFWPMARALTKEEYDKLLANLKGINETAAEWIEKNLPDNWATSDFQRDSYIYMNINVAEAFSHWIQPSRNLPISSMLERISIDLTNMFNDRRMIAINSSTRVTKYAEKLIREADEVSKSHSVLQSLQSLYNFFVIGKEQSVYEVGDSNNLKYRVDLSDNSCSCLSWQKVGIPCSHALATIKKTQEGRPYYEFCKAYYSIQRYRMAYADTINLILLDKPVNNILPIKRGVSGSTSEAGRKKSKAPTETRVMHCSLCKKSGHTKKSCKSLLS